jgi:OOP family OmpA-OmpF porin
MTSTYKKGLIAAAVALAVISGTAVAAESMVKPGYAFTRQGDVWVNSSGECWKVSDWTPAYAIQECDPQYFTQAEPQTHKVVERVTLADGSSTYFNFDGSVLRPEGETRLRDVVKFLGSFYRVDRVTIRGYADRIGNDEDNRLLSLRRAESVKAFLVGHGVDANLITTHGLGETDQTTYCPDMKRRDLINCYQPDRRVDIEIVGEQVMTR